MKIHLDFEGAKNELEEHELHHTVKFVVERHRGEFGKDSRLLFYIIQYKTLSAVDNMKDNF